MRVWLTTILAAALLSGAAQGLTLDRWLVDGPAPAAGPLFGDAAPALPALDAERRPAEGARWTPRDGADFGKADVPRAVLLAAYLDLDRYAEIELELKTDARAVLSLDGEELVDLQPGDGEGEGATTLPRGRYLLLVRAAADAGDRLRIRVKAETGAAELTAGLDPAYRLTRFGDAHLFPGVSDLALSPDAAHVLVLRRERDADGDSRRTLELWDVAAAERLAVVAVGSPSSPAWFPAGDGYTWRQDGVLWAADLATGAVRRVLADEPGLDRVVWSPDATRLFFLSAEDAPETPDPHHLSDPRERLVDWNERVVLTRLDLDTGVRRALTAPGEHQVMTFALSPDGERLALVRKVPRAGRPFFDSEIWICDADGRDARLVTTLAWGFEIWPANLAWSPDGTRLAFTGPAGEVGEGRPEHNWSRTLVWLLDIADGELTRVPTAAVDDRSGTGLVWTDDATLAYVARRGHATFVVRRPLDRSIPGMYMAVRTPVSVTASGYAHLFAMELYEGADVSTEFAPPGPVAVTRVDDDLTPEADLLPPTPAPDAVLAEVESAVFTHEDGLEIDGWLYWPPDEPREDLPLVVYYYGGAVTVGGGFNYTHQWLAANGYAVYVTQPARRPHLRRALRRLPRERLGRARRRRHHRRGRRPARRPSRARPRASRLLRRLLRRLHHHEPADQDRPLRRGGQPVRHQRHRQLLG